MSTGNFVEVVSTINGLSPGYGKMMLLYSTKKNVAVSSLTATAINAEIAAGTIIGIVQGWNAVAAASIAEKNLARANGSFRKIDGSRITPLINTFFRLCRETHSMLFS